MRGRRSSLLIILLMAAGCVGEEADQPPAPAPTTSAPPEPYTVAWRPQVDLDANGYEPSIAIDSKGHLYVTAHKELNRPETWPYPASWMLTSRDEGRTWTSLTSPAQVHEKYVGDEGDIAIDGRDWVYFLDTYLEDNHLHVWSDAGQTWQYSIEQHSTAVDDRPWIAAQGQGVLHYLGNNGAPVNGGRYWYYRSTDAGLTWSTGIPVLGNGWATVEAERNGDYAYIVTEEGASSGDLTILVSKDQGATWSPPIPVAERAGAGLRYPIVTVDQAGTVYVLFGVDQGQTTELHLARSLDHGQTWTVAEITPFEGYLDYPWVQAGPPGAVAVGFYATTDVPLKETSKWYVYGGLAFGADGTSAFAGEAGTFKPVLDDAGMPRFNFSRADPSPVYTGMDTHALHDFFEVAVAPDGSINIAYQYTLGRMSEDGERKLHFVRGDAAA